MKRILTFIIALVISGLGLNAQNFDVIDSELQMMLSQKSNEPISINIILDSQFDSNKLNNIDNKSEKREYVISELKKFSSENQNKVMAYLQAEEGNNVTNLKSHWLVNTISCTATRDVIYKTSELSGISLIAHNGKEKLIGDYKPVKAQMQRSLIQNVTTVGADQVWAEGYTGKDVIVAVLDSGVNSEHVDLKDHLWDGGSEYPDHGWNFIDNNSNTDDHNGHGTHCAGTVCGDGTSGTQTGMAPDATLMCVKVLDDDGSGTLEALVSGIEFAVENGADILSISLGWTYPDSYVSGIMREMFENVMYAGVVASVAAGNERDGIDTIPIPYNINAPGNCPPPWLHPDQQANAGGLSAVVSVGAVNYYDEPAYFSSEGPVTWQGSQWHDYLLNLDVEIDENWLHYDNGIFEAGIGGPMSFYWGVMFPAATLQQHGGDMLSKVAVYDYTADTLELLVYYGGDYASEVLVHTQTFELTGSNSFVEIDLTSYLPIDMNQNLWIVLSTNDGLNYPAAVCSDTGDPNGRWISMDGTTWEDIVDYGLESTWMIRAYVSDESGSTVAELKSINDYEYKSSKGKLSALKADSKRAGAVSNDSNFGLIRPDVSAPGVDIVSAAYDDNDGFYSYSGTSMATPCVAGVMALMLDKNPDLTPADICRILETTATPLDYKKSNRTGSGRINAYKAYKMIEEETEEIIPGKSFFTFESGLEGWTTIDADSDGYKWFNSYHIGEGQGFNGSNCAMSQSYTNEVGVLYPDNYLVSPEKYLIDNSSKIRFMAAAQDSSWAAEHFGVAVSTASNNNANDFTTIAEWTMTSRAMGNQKSQAKGFETKATGTWFQYEVDLSQYAGQEVWLAIRHFNCSDQFVLCVDNVEIVTLLLQIPAAPQNLVAEAISSSKIQLSWDAVDDAEYYNVYYGDTFIGSAAATACIVSNVEYGTHCFTVTAVNATGESEHSNEACATVEESEKPNQPEYKYRISSFYSGDGWETWDYNYSDATGTRLLTINEIEFMTPRELVDSLFYDEKGNIIKLSTWQKDEEEWVYSCYVEYTYNEQNLRTTRKNYNNFGTTMELGGFYTYNYDENGNLTNWSLAFVGLDEYQKGVITFNEAGQKVSETIQQYDFETTHLRNYQLIEYEYDGHGNLVNEVMYMYDYLMFGFDTLVPNTYKYYEYDDFGNCIQFEQTTASGRVQERRVYTYDTSVLAENVFYYSNPENDFPVLPQMNNMLKSFEYYAENDNGELIYVTDYIFDYEEIEKPGSDIPAAPQNLVAEAISSSEIQLTWDAVDGAEYYNVYSGYEYLGYIAATACVVNVVEYGTHCYTVTAVNEAGESEHSNEACATIELPHYWNPDPSLYANNMTVIATIAIDGVEQYNTDLELGAFCNGELRGAERLQKTADRYECFLMVYGDSGDNITFKLYDHASGNILDLKSNQSLTFEANATIGDVFDPYVINFTNTVVHNQALKSGWNWYSTYIVNEGADGLANLENAVGTNGIQIKNQSKFVNQAGGNWYGTMTSTAVEDMYMIQLSSATNVALEGYEVNPADYPITLGTNWKWISYPVSASISVEEAFASANPSNGDYVKSQTGFAQYYDGLGWSGTLKTMTPGMGYMYQNKSGYAKTLVYPTSSSKGSVKTNVTTDNNHWTADYSKYPMNMTMIAVVEGAESAYEVAAFVDGECRGSARPIYVEALDSYIMFMTISGEDNEALTFKYYDVETGETYAITDEFTFSVNATVGDVMNPYVMTRGALGIDELSSSINIYPNPVDNELFLATEVRVEEIAIYDVYGRTTTVYGLQTTDFVHSIDVADLEAGVYFVKVVTSEGEIVKRFVKK